MTKPKETYSTSKAWRQLETIETRHFRKMAEFFRKENKKLKEEIAEFKKAGKKDNYIETVLKK
jgi:hypothetical protein|tara:strand:+ start:142 stop:330 length:189 start_codon:yes stop_codon:yes gene_type:complete